MRDIEQHCVALMIKKTIGCDDAKAVEAAAMIDRYYTSIPDSVEAQIRSTVRVWLECPVEQRPSTAALGIRVSEIASNVKPVYITCAVCEKEARPDCEHSYCGFRGKPIEPIGYIALSAKNFEGGVEGHAIPRMTSATTTRYPATEGERHMVATARRTEEQSSTKTGPAGIKPGPSEPSPPADRREILAQALLDRFLERGKCRRLSGVGTFRDGTKVIDLPSSYRDDFFADADAILAALDGGR